MAEQSGKRRGRPRKAVVEPEVAAPSEGAPDQRAGDGPDRPSHAGPANWAEVTPILLKIEAEHGLIGRISIPFTGPALYVRPSRSEEHTSELQSLMRISYAVFCLKKKKT